MKLNPKRAIQTGEAVSLAMTLAVCVLIGFIGGRWIGGKLGNADLGTVIGLMIGVFAAAWELIKTVRKMNAGGSNDERSEP
ncbi:MAG: AtpZ/AtpI family protein [Candidatus Poribacteria bacterium]|nr:AtpZ/AtpI family protein [Candidatus Poribacteria bacterium]